MPIEIEMWHGGNAALLRGLLRSPVLEAAFTWG